LKKRFNILPVLTLLCVLLLTACNSKGCYEDVSVRVYCHLYAIENGDTISNSIDSTTVWGVGSDSILYSNETLSTFELELNPNATQTQFVVATVQNSHTYIDTLTLEHTNKPWFQSMECGCMVFSTLTNVQTQGIIFQSAILKDADVTNIESEHVGLYFN
jgi:hypothetical protein